MLLKFNLNFQIYIFSYLIIQRKPISCSLGGPEESARSAKNRVVSPRALDGTPISPAAIGILELCF